MTILLFFMRATITGFVASPVEYKDLCRFDDECRYGKSCCVSYEKEHIGLCMDNCQSRQFICSYDSDCEYGNVCCKSEGSLGICGKADACVDAPILNKNLYDKLRKVEPALESPVPLSFKEYVLRYRLAILVEIALLVVLLVLLYGFIKEKNEN